MGGCIAVWRESFVGEREGGRSRQVMGGQCRSGGDDAGKGRTVGEVRADDVRGGVANSASARTLCVSQASGRERSPLHGRKGVSERFGRETTAGGLRWSLPSGTLHSPGVSPLGRANISHARPDYAGDGWTDVSESPRLPPTR